MRRKAGFWGFLGGFGVITARVGNFENLKGFFKIGYVSAVLKGPKNPKREIVTTFKAPKTPPGVNFKAPKTHLTTGFAKTPKTPFFDFLEKSAFDIRFLVANAGFKTPKTPGSEAGVEHNARTQSLATLAPCGCRFAAAGARSL